MQQLNKHLNKQRGMSLTGLAFILFLVIFFGFLGFRLSGPYSENFTLNNIVKTAIEDEQLSGFNGRSFKERVTKNMSINQVDVDYNESVQLVPRVDPERIELNYEQRIDLFYNIDVILTFSDTYELPS